MELQRREASKFIREMEQEGWIDSGVEYVEGGVSAFKKHTSRRGEIMRALEDAKNGVYDILLIYKLDRFGRRSSESLNYAQRFENHCQIWAVDKKAQFKSKGSMEELMAFIEFWHAKQSSEDTKIRVRDAMIQVHEAGVWTGGNPPYGYDNHPTKSNMLIINDEEANIVRIIFDMYVNKGMGGTKITAALNELGYKPRIMKLWSLTTVQRILKNPVYKGYLSYGKTETQEGEWGAYQMRKEESAWSVSEYRWDDYIIVSEEIWDKAREIRLSRRKQMSEKGVLVSSGPKNTTSSLLFSGITTCGYCGGSMCVHHETKRKRYAGTAREATYRYTYYKCLNRIKRGRAACDGEQAMYKQDLIENAVIPQIKAFMEKLANDNILKDISEFSKRNQIGIENRHAELMKELQQWIKAKETAEKMIDRVLMGEDVPFDVDTLSDRLKNAKLKIDSVNEKVKELSADRDIERLNQDELTQLSELIGQWGEIFDKADLVTKKQMIAKVVGKVTVWKGKVKVSFNMKWSEYYQSTMGAKLELAASLSKGDEVPVDQEQSARRWR
ncbi:recombinase family protein [Paenibacillus chitinolyticus]|uniref:recombinase family protein n=1 Tax=Paenibacillus chitinolyticus TaxID=79263 RepID=UPI003D018057